jgi:hypothetical protein
VDHAAAPSGAKHQVSRSARAFGHPQARFTSQLMWRWFLLDTLREVAPPRSRSPDIGDILDGVKAGMR